MAGGEGGVPDNAEADTPEGPLTFAQITHYLSTTHRAATREDTDLVVNKLSARLDATQCELTEHKATTSREFERIRECLDRIWDPAKRETSYATAAASRTGQ